MGTVEVPLPWLSVPSEDTVLRRMSPFKIKPIVLWAVGNKYTAFGKTAEDLSKLGFSPLYVSKLGISTIHWVIIPKDTDLSYTGKMSRTSKRPIIVVN